MDNSTEKFDNFCKEHLNPEQHLIVERQKGIMVVHAGAGSGKTRTITARIISLLTKQSVPAQALIALTFTNKAAREMKERVTHFLTSTHEIPFIGTFHSYCLYFLRSHREFLDIPDFAIMDSDDQDKLIKGIIARYNLSKQTTSRQLGALFSRLKNNALSGVINYDAIPDPIARDTFALYEKEKAASRCLDFDDLLLVSLRLFKSQPSIKEKHQGKVRHLLVDEYQDTNQVQHALIREMSLTSHTTFSLDSLCVVGDEDQSIYSWRGAVASMMVSFKREFPEAHSHTLEQNYRSAQSILDVANHLIQHNSQRKPKNLWSTLEGGDRVRLLTCTSGYQEGQVLVALSSHYQSRGIPLKKIAVLYRSHYQSRALEEALVRHSIAYTIVGGVQFYDRQEIKDLLAYLKLVANPYDRIAWTRAVNIPHRGLGDKFQELFLQAWDEYAGLDFKGVALRLLEEQPFGPLKREALTSFIRFFTEFESNITPPELLEYFLQKIQYQAYLQETYETAEAQERFANVKELLQAIRSRHEQGVTTLHQLLEEIALLQEYKTANTEEQDHVSLMSLHAAKGLEFDTVMISGLEEGILPSGHSIGDFDAVEEERRLFYVGITRAQQRLLLTHARYRSTYKQLSEQRISRFIKELAPDSSLQTHDASQWNVPQMAAYFTLWFDGRSAVPIRPAMQERRVFKAPDSKPGAWYINQNVLHETFGRGIVRSIQEKGADHVYLTILFAQGIKKIAARFVTAA